MMMMMMMMIISPQYVSNRQILVVMGCFTLRRIIVWVFWVLESFTDIRPSKKTTVRFVIWLLNTDNGRITLLVVFSICRNYEESYRKGVVDMNDLVRGHETKVG